MRPEYICTEDKRKPNVLDFDLSFKKFQRILPIISIDLKKIVLELCFYSLLVESLSTTIVPAVRHPATSPAASVAA